MGTTSSLQRQVIADSSQLCDACGTEAYYMFECDKCEKKVCASCCPHCPRKRNPLYRKKLHIVRVDEVPDDRKQLFKRVRCACITHGGKIAVLCQFFRRDDKCHCCDITSNWKLCFLQGRGGRDISERLHDTESGRHPGEMAFSKHNNMAYMTAPSKKTVYKLSSYDEVHVAFTTNGKCYGIACFDAGLAVSVIIESDFNLPEWQVQFLDFEGTMKKCVTYDPVTHKPLFLGPRFLSSNLSEDTLYVSDMDTHTITALDKKGDVLFQYRHANIRKPHGISADSENNIYVASGRYLVQIETGGKDCRILLDKSRQAADVVDVLYKADTKTLVVIQSNGIVTSFTHQE